MDAEAHLAEMKERKLISIGHDGKASKTMQKNSRFTVESKITIIDNVYRGYVSHDTPEDGTGLATGNILIKVSYLVLKYSVGHLFGLIRNVHTGMKAQACIFWPFPQSQTTLLIISFRNWHRMFIKVMSIWKKFCAQIQSKSAKNRLH